MMGKKGMMGGAVLRWSSRYLAILWNGFMKPVRSCVEEEDVDSDSVPAAWHGIQVRYTVEPLLKDTPEIRTPLY